MRLIDADAFREAHKMAEQCKDCKRYNKWECDEQMYSARDICEWLDDAETIDAEPVRHGRWIKKDIFYCSKCDMPSMRKWPYCERCGAKMDEEESRKVAEVENNGL